MLRLVTAILVGLSLCAAQTTGGKSPTPIADRNQTINNISLSPYATPTMGPCCPDGAADCPPGAPPCTMPSMPPTMTSYPYSSLSPSVAPCCPDGSQCPRGAVICSIQSTAPSSDVSPSPSSSPSPSPSPSSSSSSSVNPRQEPSPSSSLNPRQDSSPSSSVNPKQDPSPSSSVNPRQDPSPSSSVNPRQSPSSSSSSSPFVDPKQSPSPSLDSRRSPSPSNQKPKPSFNAASSALPSRWPVPSKRPLYPPIDKLPLTIVFSNTNGSSLVEPAHLQQLQAAFGCTLQVPLEHIVLTNISHIINGMSNPVPFDRTAANLNSNGTIICLVPRNRRLLMERQLQTSSSVAVSVDILEVPDYLAMLNSTELATIVEGSSSLQLVASSTGSSGLSLLIAVGSVDSQPTVTGPIPATASNIGLITGLAVFAGCCVIMMVVGGVVYYRLRQKPITSRSKTIVVVDAPFSQIKPAAHLDTRIEFSPQIIRQPVV